MPFNLPYKFQMSGREVVVQHSHSGHIRVSPNNTSLADGGGGEGQFARWKIYLEGGNHCRLQSVKTGKYLRLWRGGREIDVNGGTGPFTKFKIHYHNRPNGVKLESDRFPGRYIAVNPNRTMKIGSGGHHCNLWIKREGQPQRRVVQQPQVRVVQQPQVRVVQSGGSGWGLPYMFRQNNTVVVRSNYGKHLRVSPGNTYNADGNGGTGQYARWKVILDGAGVIKLQNTHSGKYLRIEGNNQVNVGGTGGHLTRFRYHIHTSPNGVKLESCKFPGRYVAIRPNGSVMKGTGGVHTRLTFYREGQQQRVVQPTVVVQQQPVQPQVIVQNPSNLIQQQQLAAQQAALQQQQAQQQAQLAAQKQQMEAQMAAQQAQMNQQMEQMRLQNEASLSQQRLALEAERQKMEAEVAAQQQQVLDAQKQLLEQQQAQLSQSSLQNVQSPVSQNEGISSPVNPYYGNNASNSSTAGGGDQPPSYPVLNQPVQPVQVIQPVQQPVIVQQPEEKAPEEAPRLGQDAADEVGQWLQKLKLERYYKTFIDNGYDQLETIAEISKEDLKEMGVALGHIKIIVASCLTAPFMGKRIKIRSVSFETYVHEYGKAKDMGATGKRCILQHNTKGNLPGAIWVFECVEDQKFRLKHEPTGSFLRLQGQHAGEPDTRSPFCDWETFVLEKEEGSSGVYYIKNERNLCYLKCEKPRSLGYNKMAQTEKKDKDCRYKMLVQR